MYIPKIALLSLVFLTVLIVAIGYFEKSKIARIFVIVWFVGSFLLLFSDLITSSWTFLTR